MRRDDTGTTVHHFHDHKGIGFTVATRVLTWEVSPHEHRTYVLVATALCHADDNGSRAGGRARALQRLDEAADALYGTDPREDWEERTLAPGLHAHRGREAGGAAVCDVLKFLRIRECFFSSARRFHSLYARVHNNFFVTLQ